MAQGAVSDPLSGKYRMAVAPPGAILRGRRDPLLRDPRRRPGLHGRASCE